MELAVILIMYDRELLHITDKFSCRKPIEEWVKKNLPHEKNANTLSIILAFAILAEDARSVSLLIQYGVDIHAVVYNEMSAYQLSQMCANNSIKETLADEHKASAISLILGLPKLKPDSLIYISAKAAAKHFLKVNEKNNIGFFQNIPENLIIDEKIQKVIITASEFADDIELEQESSSEEVLKNPRI